MNEKHISVFKLCAQNHTAMMALFVCLCVLMMISLNRLLFPYFNNDVIASAYESIKNVEPRIITEILANRFGEASKIVETEILLGSDLTRDLNLYSIQNYDVYGLSRQCPSKIAIYDWGSACVDGQNYSIEIPIKSADNTLAHVTVRFRRNINSWMPYKISQYCLWAIIFAITALTFLLMKRIHRRIILPIRKALFFIEEANSNQDFDLVLSQIPLKELHCVASRLFQKQQLLSKVQIENADLQAKTKMATITTQVAHDIRSPLSSLQAAGEMLRGHVAGNPEAMDALNMLQLSGQRLEGIADGLLARHKGTESGPFVFSIHEVLDELIGELQASPLGKGVEFKKQYHTDALYVSGDKTGMARALGNIIKNALEAMGGNPEGKGEELRISTSCTSPSPSAKGGCASGAGHTVRPTSPTGGEVIIKITDTGPGISAEKIPLILEGGHTEGKEDGHGIGIKVVREVIDAHKGMLTIESEVGVGTTFIITLPSAIPTEETGTKMTVTIPYSGTGSICVIDDEPSMREQWRLTLKAQGVAVEMYASWEEYNNHNHIPSPSGEDGRRPGEGEVQVSTPSSALRAPSPPPEADGAEGEGKGPSVLVIDDDLDIHKCWRMMRTHLKVGELIMHKSIEEMIAAATNPARFNLCVIDNHIEGSQFDGARTLEYLKQNGARTVVLATGDGADIIHQDSRFQSASGALNGKVPMKPEELELFWNSESGHHDRAD